MKRAGFTMIELIFVIVILGILASVAVPKLIGVKASAEEGLAKGFVGTLNRTIGASKWSDSLMNDDDGSVDSATYNITTSDTEFPTGVVAPLAMTGCVLTGATPVALSTALTNGFNIYCLDGNESSAPKFFYADQDTTVTSTNFATAVTNGDLKIK